MATPTASSPADSAGLPASPAASLLAEALLATLPWGAVLLDAQGLMQHVNEPAARWAGTAPDALLGQPLAALGLPGALAAALLEPAGLAPAAAHEVLLPSAGQWLALTATRQPAGWVVYGQDITSQKQREQQYAVLADNTPDVLTRWGPDLRLRYANAAFATQTGLAPATALGRTLPELGLPAEVAEAYQAALQYTFATGQPQEHYYALATSTGPVQYYVRLVPELHNGEVETVLGLGRDITRFQQAETEALRASEARLRAFVETTADTVYEMSPDWRTRYVLTGKSVLDPTPEPRTDWLAGYIPADEQPRVRQAIDQALATGQPFELEHRVIQPGGTVGWTYAYAMPLRDAAGQLRKWFGTARDITARKQAEQRQQFLLQLADALRPLADPADIQDEAARQLREHLGAGWCYYNELDETGTVATIVRDAVRAGLPSLVGTYDLSAVPAYLAYLRAGNIFHAPNLAVTEWFSRPLLDRYAALGMHAALGVPLVKNGQLLAIFIVADTTPRPWTSAEVQLLQDVAERTWAALARARAEAALRRSEARYRTLFDTMTEGFNICGVVRDASGRVVDVRYLEVNRALEQQTGLDRQQVAGRLLSEIVPADDLARWMARYAGVADGGVPVTFEESVALLGRYYAVSVYPQQNDELAVFYRDITEHRQREQHQAFLLKLSDRLRAETGVAAVGNRAVQLMAEQLGVDRVYLVTLAPDDDTVVVTHETRRADLPPLQGAYHSSDFPAAIKEIFERTIVYEDVRTDDRLTELDRLSFAGLGAVGFIAASIRRGNEAMIWAAGAVSTQPRAWTAAEVSLFEDAVERTWAAVERARVEEALRQSEEKYRTLFESIDEGFAIVEVIADAHGCVTDLIYREANEAFERHSGMHGFVGKRVSDLLPQLEQHWLDLLSQIYQTGEPMRVEQPIAELGRWLHVYYSRVGGAGSPFIAVVFNDITERKQREQKLAFLAEIAEELSRLVTPDDIIQAVGGRLGAALHLNLCLFVEVEEARDEVLVQHAWQRQGGPSLRQRFRIDDFLTKEFARSRRAGETFIVRDTATDERMDAEVCARLAIGSIMAVPFHRRGRWVAYLTVTDSAPRDWRADEIDLVRETAAQVFPRLERARAEEALRQAEERYRDQLEQQVAERTSELQENTALLQATMDSSMDMIQVFAAVRDAAGDIVDFTWRLNNHTAEQLYGNVLGKSLLALNPGVVEAGIFATFKQVVETGVADQSERHYVHEQFDGWFYQSTVKLGDGVATTTGDITNRKEAEQALQRSKSLLQDIIDAPAIGLAVYQAVRTPTGEIVDFVHEYINRASRDMLGEDFTGQLLSDHGENGTSQLRQFEEVLATGRGNAYVREISFRGRQVWFAITNTPLDGDRLVHTWEDVTARQQAEQERIKNLRLLEQAEAVAGLGSWDYNLLTGELRWSDGMYHLFGLPLGGPVRPEVYLQFVLAEDRALAEQLVTHFHAGQSNFETIMRLRVGEQVKTVRIKVVVLYGEAGQPTRMLGVDLNVSELQRLEADNLRLRLTQQQALFEAVQAAQEQERKRMAESLHNGIGQILYATKLRLDRLQEVSLPDPVNLATARHEAQQLLSDAIRQTRALSHELVPLVLEEFGLAAALRDVSHKMSSPQLQLRSHVDLDAAAAPLPLPLQLALYRMAQELAQNIVKHAHGATEASLELETVPGWVLLRVEDNGPGFVAAAKSPGLGLRNIRDRVMLLGGQLEHGSSALGGAYVRIRIPLPPVSTSQRSV